MIRLAIATLCLVVAAAAPALANGFRPVADRDDFVAAIEGRELTRFGIRLDVTPAGEISGRAFGRPVTGAWRWEDGHFCRDLAWGQRDLGANCQAVHLSGQTIRFISDRGTGQFADLTLD